MSYSLNSSSNVINFTNKAKFNNVSVNLEVVHLQCFEIFKHFFIGLKFKIGLRKFIGNLSEKEEK